MRWRSILFLLIAIPGSTLEAVPIRLATVWQGGAAPPETQVSLRLEPHSAPSQDTAPEPVEITAPLAGEVKLDLPPDTLWQITGRAPGTWSAPLWLDSGPGPEKMVTLRLFPSGTLRGRLKLSKNAKEVASPGDLEIRVRNVPGQSGVGAVPPSNISCRVIESSWQCELPAGTLDLRLRIPGFIPVYRWGTHIEPGESLDLGPIPFKPGSSISGRVLLRPVAFQAEIDPPVDPYGEPWKIRLQARDALTDRPGNVFRGTATPEGRWTHKDLAPGRYHFDLLTETGSSWTSEIIEISPGEASPLRVRVPVLEVRGRIRLGDEPLSGTLWLGGRFGSRRIRFEADAEGRFEGFLPGPGRWNADLLSEEELLRLVLDPLVIEPLPGKTWAEVDIQVPNTRLRGEVVDEKGKPLPEARLRLFRPGHGLSQAPLDKTNAEIDVRGLPAGTVGVEALEGERTSGWAQVVLEEGTESPWLRLVVRDLQTLQGRIVSSRGGVPGARIRALPWVEGDGISTQVEAVTGPQGEFSLSIPASARSLTVEVLPPGFALRMLRTEIEPGKPLELAVEPQGGTLIVELGQEETGPMPIVHHGGALTPLQRLEDWARLLRAPARQAGRVVIPDLEPGEYTLCTGAPARCTSGVLAPFGELVLRVPATEGRTEQTSAPVGVHE